jgi:hypothetical protein
MNSPVAPSVVSFTIRSNVKALKYANLVLFTRVEHELQATTKSPKPMFEGTPAPLVVFGPNVIVADSPTWVCDIRVEVKPLSGPPNNPQSDR